MRHRARLPGLNKSPLGSFLWARWGCCMTLRPTAWDCEAAVRFLSDLQPLSLHSRPSADSPLVALPLLSTPLTQESGHHCLP